jgi:hypothetical protein
MFMDIPGVNPSAQSSNLKAAAAARNPANKKALMAAYSEMRKTQTTDRNKAIITATFGSKAASAAGTLEGVTNAQSSMVLAAQKAVAAAVPSAATATTPQAAPAGNTLTDTRRMDVTIASNPANKGNTVRGNEGFANTNNRVTLNGANNTVDMSGNPGAGVSRATFQATGGAAITNARVNVTGNANEVRFNGGRQDNATLAVNGSNNKVNVGNNVDNANINLAGNNVTVNMAANGAMGKSQNGWNINVSASNLAVTVENGKATVQGAGGNENLNIEIDNEKRTVTVTPREALKAQADNVPAKVPLPSGEPTVNPLAGAPQPENVSNG